MLRLVLPACEDIKKGRMIQFTNGAISELVSEDLLMHLFWIGNPLFTGRRYKSPLCLPNGRFSGSEGQQAGRAQRS